MLMLLLYLVKKVVSLTEGLYEFCYYLCALLYGIVGAFVFHLFCEFPGMDSEVFSD